MFSTPCTTYTILGVGPRGLAAVVRQRLAHHRYPRLLALHVVGPSRLPAIGHTPVGVCACAHMYRNGFTVKRFFAST